MVQMTYFGVIRSMAVASLCFSLPACGFYLQGQQPHTSADTLSTNNIQLPVVIDAQASKPAYALRLSLLKQLTRYDVNAHINNDNNNDNDDTTLTHLGIANRIIIDDVSIQKYQLAGLLTEVHLTMTAKVRYQIQTDNKTTPMIISHTLMLERSYQYNQTSVSVEDLQRHQTEADLYDAMSQRIADQYDALLMNTR